MNSESTYQKFTDKELIHLINLYDEAFISYCEKHRLSLDPSYYNSSVISTIESSIKFRKIKILKDHC